MGAWCPLVALSDLLLQAGLALPTCHPCGFTAASAQQLWISASMGGFADLESLEL